MDGSPSHGLTLNHLPKSIKSKFKDSSKYKSYKKKQETLDKQRQKAKHISWYNPLSFWAIITSVAGLLGWELSHLTSSQWVKFIYQ